MTCGKHSYDRVQTLGGIRKVHPVVPVVRYEVVRKQELVFSRTARPEAKLLVGEDIVLEREFAHFTKKQILL